MFYRLTAASALGAELDAVTVVQHEYVFGVHANRLSELGMSGEMSGLAVNRHEERRLHEVQHELELFRCCVT